MNRSGDVEPRNPLFFPLIDGLELGGLQPPWERNGIEKVGAFWKSNGSINLVLVKIIFEVLKHLKPWEFHVEFVWNQTLRQSQAASGPWPFHCRHLSRLR